MEADCALEEEVRFTRSDIIAVIFGFLGSSDETTLIWRNPKILHPAIFWLRDRYPILRHFAFSNEAYFYSKSLERAMNILAISMWLKGPDYECYQFGKALKKRIAERLHCLFDNAQLFELWHIAKELERSCALSPQQAESHI